MIKHVSYTVYMLDDDGELLNTVCEIEEDGKPEGFAGSIADWALHRATEACVRAATERPGERFCIEMVVSDRVYECVVPRGFIKQIEVNVEFKRDAQ